MIDFSTLQGVTIPEGVVTQIADASGNVLWSARRNVLVKITSGPCQGINGDSARLTITSPTPFAPDPSNPSVTTTTWTVEVWEEPSCTIEIPVGSTIDCYTKDSKQNNRCYVVVNNTANEVLAVVSGVNPATYLYTVKCNATIMIRDSYSQGEYGYIVITEEVE